VSSYKVLSPEGAERYATEIGEIVTADLSAEEELALVAAGWLEKTKEKPDK
jgi:hypothetical protein